ncbi:MAG: helix-turn-helix domain-containing protein [Caldimonas sp.]
MTSDSTDSGNAVEGVPSLAVRCVRALMERHGLPKYRQSPWLADAFGLSYSQAHRRMTGASTWTLEDLERVGALFGESLVQVVTLDPVQGSVLGAMRLGPVTLDCQLWLGDVVANPRPDSLVAINTSMGWAAVVAGETTEGVTYKIDRLVAKPSVGARKVIAVLDDDQDLTNSICAHFESSGYEARPFYKTADLASSAKVQRYDGFVIDWIVGESSTIKLIASLREEDASAPIVVLTAQVLMGIVDETDIAEAVKTFGLVFSEKPVRMSILSATLALAFAATR